MLLTATVFPFSTLSIMVLFWWLYSYLGRWLISLAYRMMSFFSISLKFQSVSGGKGNLAKRCYIEIMFCIFGANQVAYANIKLNYKSNELTLGLWLTEWNVFSVNYHVRIVISHRSSSSFEIRFPCAPFLDSTNSSHKGQDPSLAAQFWKASLHICRVH